MMGRRRKSDAERAERMVFRWFGALFANASIHHVFQFPQSGEAAGVQVISCVSVAYPALGALASNRLCLCFEA
jgi:hypothetical protein